jgi:hypothetical protein
VLSESTLDNLSASLPTLSHATVSQQVEDCINFELEPRPVSYGAKRRMARRFDEALIVEIEPVALR